MVIRATKITDAPRIACIHVESWRGAYRGLISDAVLDAQSVERREIFWRKRLSEMTGAVFVAEDNGVVFGFCDLIPSRDKDADSQIAEIAAIYILPNFWRKGAGRLLCDSALAEARHQKYKLVTLWILASNKGAKHFYETIGFRSDGATKTVKMVDGSELNEMRFRIDLV